ncbi:MAG TPA: MBL fold metallo-hydrolase [Hyphomicrobiaceae bacterium]|nr:MBL fold metallo-hydrolase [Hyphomicrobiaceae bacterium]
MTDIEFRTDMAFSYGEPTMVVPEVRRLVANNPSVFTFKGTNTYILGSNALAIIDPGPDDDAHFEATMRAVGRRRVSHILITHTHRDHIDGLPRLAKATGATICGFGRASPESGARKVSPSGTEFVDEGFVPDLVLKDGDEVAGDGWAVRAMFTPGHAPDHLCFAMPDQNVIFSGDHVMGWNTSVVAPPEGNMQDYMASLERMAEGADAVYFPGHGGRIEKGSRIARAYLVHRRLREQSILEAIQGGHGTIKDIVTLIYRELDPRLFRAASLSVEAHVDHLIERGRVAKDDGAATATAMLRAV